MKTFPAIVFALGLCWGAAGASAPAKGVPVFDNLQDFAVESRTIQGKQSSSRLYLMWIGSPSAGISHLSATTNDGLSWNLRFPHGSRWYKVGDADFLCLDATNRYLPEAYLLSFRKGENSFDGEWSVLGVRNVSSLLIGDAYRKNNTNEHRILSVVFDVSPAVKGNPVIRLADKHDSSKIYRETDLQSLLKEAEKLKECRTVPGRAGLSLYEEDHP